MRLSDLVMPQRTRQALLRAVKEHHLPSAYLFVGPSGVGKRTAQRLLIELKARLEVPDLDLTAPTGGTSTPRSEVRDALIGLGYSVDEVRTVLGQLPDDGTVEELLRDALRVLAGSR